jgi:flavin-dependent dehydrogenase
LDDAHKAQAKVDFGAKVRILEGGKALEAGGQTIEGDLVINCMGMSNPANREGVENSDLAFAYRAIYESGGESLEVPRNVHMRADVDGVAQKPAICWLNQAPKNGLDLNIVCIGQPPDQATISATKDYLGDFHHVSYGEETHSGTYCIPVGRPLTKVGEDGVLRLGDAGLSANPITGSGIVSAIRAAHDAGRMVRNHNFANGNQLTEEEQSRYVAAIYRAFGGEHAAIHGIKGWQLRTNPPNVDSLFESGAMTPDDLARNMAGKCISFGPLAIGRKMVLLLPYLGLLGEMSKVTPGAMVAKLIGNHMPEDPEKARKALRVMDRVAG